MTPIKRAQSKPYFAPQVGGGNAPTPARLPTSFVIPDLAPTDPTKSVAVKGPYAPNPVREREITKLMAKMSLDDKVMQLVMIPWDNNLTGPDPGQHDGSSIDWLRRGAGWVLNPNTGIDARTIRRVSAQETKLGIPASVSFDVISGDYTLGPQLMGTACSGDPEIARLQGLIAAREARSRDIDLTFAPNVDVSPGLSSYGRAIESFGSSSFLIKKMAAGNIRGFHEGKLATCTKHFAGYGQPRTGIDYGGAVLSKSLLDRTLIPFKEMVASGTDCIMAAFNTINGIPCHQHEELFRVLRAWGFDGVVISDWTGIAELIAHGPARDRKHAAELAINAGVDVDMSSGIYRDHLAELVKEGKVSMATLDESVRRVLRYKMRRGLFDEKLGNPNAEKEAQAVLGPEHRAIARYVAERSLVLLKNDAFGGKPALPIEGDVKKVAVVGAIADNAVAYLGHWRGRGEINGPANEGKPHDVSHIVTAKGGLVNRFGADKVAYAPGNYVLQKGDAAMWADAKAAAKDSDVVFLVIGETAPMSGEGATITNEALPVQQSDVELAKELFESGHKVVIFNVSGRPKPGMQELEPYCHALVQGFQPGTEAGNAFVNVVTGKRADGTPVNFTGKLSVELPRTAVDMLSVHHERETTGRPAHVQGADGKFTWGPAFFDPKTGAQLTDHHPLHVNHRPAFPFGFGLSYSTIAYGAVEAAREVSRRTLWDKGHSVSITLKNDSKRAATEYVQAYMQLLEASENQPEKRLVGTAIVELAPGEEKKITLNIPAEEFEFASERAGGARVLEPGKVLIGVGASSDERTWSKSIVTVTKESTLGRPWEVQAARA